MSTKHVKQMIKETMAEKKKALLTCSWAPDTQG
jgi:hypothetical protein